MAEGKPPENPRSDEGNRAGDREMKDEPERLFERLDQDARGNVRDDDDGHNPAKNDLKEAREDLVGIARDLEEIEVAVDQTLRAHDPETDRAERKHDGVVDRDPEYHPNGVERDRCDGGNDLQLLERDDHNDRAEPGVEHTVESELFRRHCKLAVDRQRKQRVEFSGSDQLREVREVHEEERLEQLRNHLVGADKQHDLPLRPIADPVDVAENDAEENDLAAKPEDFDDQPEKKIRFETQLTDERVAQHDRVDLKVTTHRNSRRRLRLYSL